jgi:hypothetical protein
LGAISGSSVDGATGAVTLARLIAAANGAASTPPMALTGTWFTGGTATTTKPALLIEPTGTTSTAWSTNGTGLGVNAPSGFPGNLLDLQLNGVSRFSVASTGLVLGNSGVFRVTPDGFVTGARFLGSGNDVGIYSANNPAFALGSNSNIFWERGTGIAGARDVGFFRFGSGIIGVNDGGLSNSTILRDLALLSASFYWTYASATSYELGKSSWKRSTSDAVVTGSVSNNSTTLTVTGVSSGALAVGQIVTGANVLPNTRIAALGTGTGAEGTYILNRPQTPAVASTTITAGAPAFCIGTEKGADGGTARDMELQTDGVTRITVKADGAILFSGAPTSNPNVAGQLWNDGGTLKISAG